MEAPGRRPGMAPLVPISPAARLGAAFALGCCAAVLQKPGACAAALLAGALLVLLHPPAWKTFLRRLALVNLFILMLWLIVPLTGPGPDYARWGIFGISREGVRIVFLATLKANAIFCIFSGLCGGMTITDLAFALRRLRAPANFTLLFLFMGRAFYILSLEWRSLEQAARLRAFTPRLDFHTWRTLGSLLALLLVKSHDRAIKMREAMLLRAYEGGAILLRAAPFTRKDLIFALLALAAITGLLGLELGCANA